MIALGEQKKPKYFAWIAAAALLLGGVYVFSGFNSPTSEAVCPQIGPLSANHSFTPSHHFYSEKYTKKSAELLAGAVQIPTESFDDMARDPTADERFKTFGKLHAYLDASFPLIAEYKETINSYGLLYTIPGTEDLEPILYMAHQDVVPVNHETWDQWDHEPFSGDFDGEWLYGRGSCDTKNTVVAQLEAIEALLEQGWTPKRTVLMAYGFDEECDGSRGAHHLAQEIEKRYGTHAVKLIVDEGDGIDKRGDKLFALPAVAEKGIIDFNIEALTPGGHSSLPPAHTGIGILSALVVALEENPLTAGLAEDSIWTEVFGCFGQWDEDLDAKTRAMYTGLDKASNRRKLVKALAEEKATRYYLRTSQAVDVINGGVKINALPEKVTVQVDHRIAVHESIGQLKDRLSGFVLDLCKDYKVGAVFDGKSLAEGANGLINITSFGGYDPAPISPTSGEVWDSLAGVTKHVFGDLVFGPNVMLGNTDTGNYWNVSKSIYRYNPCFSEDMFGLHTVNEKLRFRSHLSAVAWFYEFTLFWTI